MKSYSKTGLMELSHKYRSILKKCAILNALLFTLIISTKTIAGGLPIVYGKYDEGLYYFAPNMSSLVEKDFNGILENDNFGSGITWINGGFPIDLTKKTDIENNQITINATDLSGKLIADSSATIVAGNSVNGNAIKNTLLLKNNLTLENYGSSIYEFIAGKSTGGNSSKNNVFINNSISTTGTVKLYGGYSSTNSDTPPLIGNSFNNTVILGSQAGGIDFVYGGYSEGGNANDNTVKFNNVTSIGSKVIGGSGKQSTNRNTINIVNSNITGNIMVGSSSLNDSTYNTVTAQSSTLGMSEIYAGMSEEGSVSNNTIMIDGGTSSNSELYLIGGMVSDTSDEKSTAQNNKVIIKNNFQIGSSSVMIIGGSAINEAPNENYPSSGNLVYLNSAMTGTDAMAPANLTVAAFGLIDDTEAYANNNTVVIGKDASFNNINLTLYGLWYATGINNTLEVWSKNFTADSLIGFNRYNFILNPNLDITQPVISVTNATNIISAEFGVTTQPGIDLDKGDKVILINQTIGTLASGTPSTIVAGTLQGEKDYQIDEETGKVVEVTGGSFTTDYTFELSLEETATPDVNALIATVTGKNVNDEIKAPSEGQVSSVALLNAGSDLVANAGLENALSATKGVSGNVASFSAISGGYSKYKPGSHINLASASLLTGFSKKFTNNLMSGIFVEVGYGNYTTHNNFTKGKVKGDGDSKYYGLGFMGRYDITRSLYAEASIRGGYLNNDWKSNDTKVPVDYDTDSLYYGAHLGLGYDMDITDTFGLNVYGKYFYTHQEGDDTTIDGTKFDFKDVDSHLTRLGTRFYYNKSKDVKPFMGFAWDHEFDGKAKADAGDVAVDAPSLKGDTGMLEFGLKATQIKGSNWEVDTSLQGFIGKREGIQGIIKAKYNF